MPRLKPYIGEYYHIYNRGVNKRKVFMEIDDYQRFLIMIKNFSKVGPLVGGPTLKFICYCLNPNHYHFLLKQLKDGGIEKFMQRIGTDYTMYFNKKYNRSGVLFARKYQIRHVSSNAGLLWLSGYINGNPEIHNITLAKNYKWSSCLEYLNKTNNQICNSKKILN